MKFQDLVVKYPFLQFMANFKALSLISNVIYWAMTATFCPLYREFPYLIILLFRKDLTLC